MSSLDCLALGYLCLMLVPELPQPWLAKVMRNKFPEICTWTQEWRSEVFGPETGLEDAFTERSPAQTKKSRLPWKVPASGGVAAVGGTFLSNIADSIPIVGKLRRNTRMRRHGGKASEGDEISSWQTITVLSSLLASVGLVAGYMFYQGLIPSPISEEPEKRRGGGFGAFGEAGDMLSLYANQMDRQLNQQQRMERDMNEPHAVPIVEVEVGPDGVRSTEAVA